MYNMPVGQPWQMIAVDVLKVTPSTRNNRYLLVIQDYFTKWATAIPMADQTATRIKTELTKLFSVMGLPQVVHSDQGSNFESTFLKQVLQAYGIKKSRTTACHPQSNSMAERFNRSLLQLLQSCTQQDTDWELHLPLALFAYRTAVHSSTGVLPFEMMFGRAPKLDSFPSELSFDLSSYKAQLHSFNVGDLVWLSQPTAGKLDPRWDGSWIIKSFHSPVTLQITNGKLDKVVHINHLCHRIQPPCQETIYSHTPIATDHTWRSHTLNLSNCLSPKVPSL